MKRFIIEYTWGHVGDDIILAENEEEAYNAACIRCCEIFGQIDAAEVYVWDEDEEL